MSLHSVLYCARLYTPRFCSAIIKLKTRIEDQSLSLAELPEIHSFLDGFYLSRIGIRILIGQHVSLHEEKREGYIGAINTACDPHHLVQQAISCAPPFQCRCRMCMRVDEPLPARPPMCCRRGAAWLAAQRDVRAG